MAKPARAKGRGVFWLRLALWLVLASVLVYAADKFKSLDDGPKGPDTDAVARVRKSEIAALFAAHQGAWTPADLEANLGQSIRMVRRTFDDPRTPGGAPPVRERGELFEQRDGVSLLIRFTFVDGVWTNWGLVATAPPLRSPSQLATDPFVVGWLEARPWGIRAAQGLWLLLMIAAVLAWRTRHAPALVHGAMIAALLAAAAAEARPGEAWLLPGTQTLRNVTLSLAMIGLSLIVLAVLARRARRVRRNLIAAHVCLECGYDCRATPDHCPECGTAAPA